MRINPATLYNLASNVLDAIVAGWPVGATALPERQYVTFGDVAWDCEQLVVAIERVFGIDGDVTGETYIQDGTLRGFQGVTVGAWLIRCVPDIDSALDGQLIFPSVADLDASAQILCADPIHMWNTIASAQAAGAIASCNGLAFQDADPAGPLGGFGGTLLRVRMQILAAEVS